MRVRLIDIAGEVGVRASTVSLVLNNHPKAQTFSPATCEKIRQTAARMGYIPNAAARALVTQRTYNIGFIIPEYASQRWSNQFYSDILNGIDEVCCASNYSLFVHCCDLGNALKFVFPRGVSERNVDGLLVGNAISPEVLKRFEELNIPCVRVGAFGNRCDSVIPEFAPDLPRGLVLALEYLVRLGHSKVMIFDSGSAHTKGMLKRLDQCLENNGLHERVEILRHFTPDGKCDETSASEFMSDYFSCRPSAVITNPQTCLGIYREIEKYGLRCPADLSIISNYDFNLFDFVSPAITSLRYDNSMISAAAARALIQGIESGGKVSPESSRTDFPLTLEIRGSCAAVSQP